MRLSHLGLILVAGLGGGLPAYGQQNELRSLANTLAQDIAAAGKKTIAVVDFVDLQGNTSELGRFLAEEFSVALARTHKGFEVVERNQLKAILAEHKLTATGLIDQATAKKLGEFAGADAIVTGSMTPFSESVRVAVKVLATDTARIIAADSTDVAKTQTISELLSNPVGGNRPASRVNDRPPSAYSPGAGQPGGNAVPSSPVVVAQQFQYELIECKGMANSVTCSLRVTNRGPDRTLVHWCGKENASYKSEAFDNLGNESWSDECTISNHTRGGLLDVTQALLVSGVPTSATVLFPNVGASATTLALITIRGVVQSNRGGENLTVSFRNVPIVR